MISMSLDTHAVRQLFPEGTEAQVNLRRSVIQNITKDLILKDTNNRVSTLIKEEIKAHPVDIPSVKDEVNKQMNKLLSDQGWKGIQASDIANFKIREEAEKIASNAIQDYLVDQAQRANKKLEHHILHVISQNENKIDELIRNRINNAWTTILDEAIKVRIAQVFPEVK
ncbi:Hypothetical protein KNT65_gp087 [Escherichia phage EcS1]|uniref:Uncharacterized protein n=1 Tax=Escherichia phage EcS1 TaxID=2083276 RepID=A0A2Z5ZCE1_9CAUD|nr:Hypothetical protein KNT65_gp087 [Escherichia phage EcS1]BBC78135.1 Hypothetical protein [Escherichia phage EcS1]